MANSPRIFRRNPLAFAANRQVILIVFGCIWFLQGVNVLAGSFMTGQIRWAVYGGIAIAVGISVLLATAKRRSLKG